MRAAAVVITGTLACAAGAAPASARTIEAERAVASTLSKNALASLVRGKAVHVEAGRGVKLTFPVRDVRALGVRTRPLGCKGGTGKLIFSGAGLKRTISAEGSEWEAKTWSATAAPGELTVSVAAPDKGCAMLVDKIEVKERVPIGVAMWHRYTEKDARYAPTVLGHFDAITPENEMKMFALQPERGVFDFSQADRIVDFAARNGKAVHGHTLVWTAGTPGWMHQRDLFNRPVLTREELLQILEVHIKTVVGRYKGRVQSWDVVNEAYVEDGRMRPNIFLEVIGPEYVELAYRWAHEADPKAKLYYNETAADIVNPTSNAVLNMARDFLSRGVPLHGVGFQHHIAGEDPQSVGQLRLNISRFARLGLEVAVSELDVTTKKIRGSEEHKSKVHAEAFAAAARTCELEPMCKRLTVWGVADHLSWLGPDEHALAFDSEYRPKPAWDAITSVLGHTL